MKILFYINILSNGGAERVMANLANHFSIKHDVILVNSFKTKNEYSVNECIKHLYIDANKKGLFLRNIQRVSFLRKLIKNEKPDLCVSFMAESNFRLLVASFGLKTKTIISIRAVSEKFMMLQGLLEEYQQTKELVSNRDSFFSNLKFDFVTPLNAAIGFSQSLLDNVCDELNTKQKKYVSIINTNIKKVNAMMEKVFDIIALDAGKKEFNFKSFDFIKIFNFLEETFTPKAKEKNLKIEFHNEVERRNVFSEEYALIHIMSYLIENAIKFTESGEIEVLAGYPDIMFLEMHGIKIPSGYNEKSYIHLSVKDSGIGIDEEHLITIFDEYNVKNNQVVKKYGGTALSLPICSKLVQKLSGVIWCESDGEKGSIFHVVIPVERMSFEQ